MNQLKKSRAGVLSLTLLLSCYAFAAQQGGKPQNGYALKAGFPNGKVLYVPVPERGEQGVLAIVPTAAGQGGEDAVTGVTLVPRVEGNGVRVLVSALYGSLDKVSPCNLAEVKQRFVGSYRAGAGEEIRVPDLTGFGLEPLTINVASADPTPQRAPAPCCKCEETGIACCPNTGECLTCSTCGVCCKFK